MQELHDGSDGVHLSLPRTKRKDCVNREPIIQWFHESSPDVEIDKADKHVFKRKRAMVGGTWRTITCERRILLCSKKEAVQHFFESEFYRSWKRADPELELSDNVVQQCICYCMKPRRGEVCARARECYSGRGVWSETLCGCGCGSGRRRGQRRARRCAELGQCHLKADLFSLGWALFCATNRFRRHMPLLHRV